MKTLRAAWLWLCHATLTWEDAKLLVSARVPDKPEPQARRRIHDQARCRLCGKLYERNTS